MKDLIILGAGGAAMDIASVIEDVNNKEPQWNILGFLDDNTDLLGKIIADYPVLGTIEDCVKYPEAYYISSIAHPKNRIVRELVYNRVARHGFKFATIVHPSTVILKGCKIEEGAIVRANCVLGAYSYVGADVSISNGTVLSHEAKVGAHSTLASGVKISSGVNIGKNCYIGCGVSTTHDIRIEDDLTLGVGTVVVSNLSREKGDIWVGVPAKPIKSK